MYWLYCAARETIATHFAAMCQDILCKKPKPSVKATKIRVRNLARNVPDKRRRAHNLTKIFRNILKKRGPVKPVQKKYVCAISRPACLLTWHQIVTTNFEKRLTSVTKQQGAQHAKSSSISITLPVLHLLELPNLEHSSDYVRGLEL